MRRDFADAPQELVDGDWLEDALGGDVAAVEIVRVDEVTNLRSIGIRSDG